MLKMILFFTIFKKMISDCNIIYSSLFLSQFITEDPSTPKIDNFDI